LLHSFQFFVDGAFPRGGLIFDGALYGVTYSGGNLNFGVAFKLDQHRVCVRRRWSSRADPRYGASQVLDDDLR
jgi:hypothetical protein